MASGQSSGALTILLRQGRAGDLQSVHEFMRLVYPVLKQLAAGALRCEWLSRTMQHTVLVHEAILRLFRGGWSRVPWESQAEFFAGASREMRQIVLEHARRRKAQKRGGEYVHIHLDEESITLPEQMFDRLLVLDEALAALEQVDPRCARVVELLFFGSLSKAETAAALGIHVRTVERDWKFAKAFLSSAIAG